MRSQEWSRGRNVFLLASGILLGFLNSVESQSPESPPPLEASVERMDFPQGIMDTITFSGTDTIIESAKWRTSRPREGLFTVLTVLRADGTSHTVVAENEVWGTVRSGDLLYTIEKALSTSKPVSLTYRVREYDLRTGKARALITPQEKGLQGIDLYNSRLQFVGYIHESAENWILSMGTMRPVAGDFETTYTVLTKELLPQEILRMRRFRLFRGSAYFLFEFTRQKPQYAVYRVDFASKTAVKLLEASRYLDFCIVPDGPRLAYLCEDSSSSETQHAYTLTFFPLGEAGQKPLTAKLNAGEIQFYGGLQYDAKDRSFVIRGNTPPYHPPNYFYYRIRVRNIPK